MIKIKQQELESNSVNMELEISKLMEVLKQNDKDEVLKQISYLSTLVNTGNINAEIKKLRDIVKTKGLGREFMIQLDYISSFFDTKIEPYVPVSKKFRELYKTGKKQKGVSFLCPEIDRRTGGMIAPSVSVIMGGSGCMKTTYAINTCYQALKEGKNVAYLSLEESPQQLYSKLLSRVSIDVGKPLSHMNILQHKLSYEEEDFLFNEVIPYLEKLSGRLLIVGETDFISYDLFELELKLREVDNCMKEESKNNNMHGIDILVVDHIQLLKYAGEVQYEYSTINKYVSFFRNQSLSFLHQKREIIVILLSQVNREGIKYASKHGGQYLISHIGEASEIERSASYIVSVYSDAENQVSKILKIGALKLRGASLPMDTINIFSDGLYYQVGDTSIPEQPEYDIEAIVSNNDNANNKSFQDALDEWGM